MTRIALIYNPSAGRRQGESIATALLELLEKQGFDAQVYPTGGSDGGAVLARRVASTSDVVVAVGGDGTVNEVINGLAGSQEGSTTSQATLGIVPAGTVNVLARELGLLPCPVERACDIITRGKTIALDLGRANSRYFALMMGAGIDALTVRNLDLEAKRRFKELAFVATGLVKGFAKRPPAFLVRTEGRDYRATFLVAGNCRLYANRLSLTRQADPTDGLLDLLVFTGESRPSLAAFWLGVPSGLHLRHPQVTYLRCRGAELLALEESPAVVWFQTDGELAGMLPVTVHVVPRAIRILVP